MCLCVLQALSVAVYSETKGRAFKMPAPNRPFCAATAVLNAHTTFFGHVVTVSTVNTLE
jgi:hypothetical protein